MTKAMMVIVVAGLALGGGACAPGMKPAGYAGGLILTAGGAAMLATASASCSGGNEIDDAAECFGGTLVFGPTGVAALVAGLAVLAVTVASPDGEKGAAAKPLPPVTPPPSEPTGFTPQPTAPASRPPSGPPSLPSLPTAATGKPASLAFH